MTTQQTKQMLNKEIFLHSLYLRTLKHFFK